jgi:hypothetical protein
LVEARKQASGCYQASIVEYDNEFKYLKERSVDFTFKSTNKGFEAVASGAARRVSIKSRNLCASGKALIREG